ncbi:ImmA/IrrE family metallo-endopeptidase [Paenibacillus sp. OV219]|uniref:ImmA/IrrE family metallo-endopeptidase n=1 Tax=Paenibacillus sp. OV219 TaxID=1884377 RepID=UPI0008C447F3|nr:ImmA/IrrE family metallo-endopeptidase [Paenibacillus sp. OV219]SEM80556.1 protein of unknown function [Paenibacillus sp. OV219]
MNYIDLILYKETDLEKWINKAYRKNGIHYASDIEIERIAAIWNVEVRTYLGPSFAEWKDDDYSFIFINAYLTEEHRRDVFFHELCHPLQHTGCQDTHMAVQFRELQETQAGLFQLYSAMPAYMLEEFKSIQDRSYYLKVLAEEFVLPLRIVERRINQIQRRIQQERIDQLHRNRQSHPDARIFSDASLRLIEQLHRQLHKEVIVSNG